MQLVIGTNTIIMSNLILALDFRQEKTVTAMSTKTNMTKQIRRANWFSIIHIALVVYILDLFINSEKTIIIYLIEVIIGLCIFSLCFNIVIFKEKQIIRIFPLRIIKREFIYNTSSIIKIRYNLPSNHNIEALYIYFKTGDKAYIRIDSPKIKLNKTFFSWYHKQGIVLDFVDIKHNNFEDLEW